VGSIEPTIRLGRVRTIASLQIPTDASLFLSLSKRKKKPWEKERKNTALWGSGQSCPALEENPFLSLEKKEKCFHSQKKEKKGCAS